MQQKSIRLPAEFITECEVIAKRTGRPRAEIMRSAMTRGVREMKALCELDINCMDDVSQELPRIVQQILFGMTGATMMIEDLLKKSSPGHDRFTNTQSFNRKIGQHIEKTYFAKNKQDK